ncbi:branched-chain amino acid ABC transporter permease [Fonticella tunisiensis]|uniref:Amino acid/amide ABC transporter membrane protein 2 (HAAT family) n=1 Tax=Fonticella tunisiensis TaxID=1096341 RepID=A0A4R7KTD3_9CLOT|nr:branched-chain amino acid ABC transporter permease [Fonticella tunisiensis]TDT63279.1 amino acid/amide ABC transporter membrane protein 2 (HAAT family) [Fonticella tunisiensis]
MNTNLFRRRNILSLFIIVFLYIAVQLMSNLGIIDSYIMLNLIIIGINIILAVSLNLITGFTGQFSLGHAAFMSIGAYASAIATTKLEQPFIVGILMAAVSAAVAGVIIGIPTLRLKGDYLAIATLGFGEIVRIIGLNVDYVGGATGLNDIPQYTNWTWIYFMVIATVLIIKNFINSYHGRACIAIKEDEIAAEAMGVNTTYYKVLAFTIGALFAGIAGALYANYFYFIKPDSFGFMKSIDILVIVVFGGMGSILGSIAGAVVLSIISAFLQSIPELRMVVYAVILFLIMVYRPNGLLGKFDLKDLKLFRKGGKVNAGIKGE